MQGVLGRCQPETRPEELAKVEGGPQVEVRQGSHRKARDL